MIHDKFDIAILGDGPVGQILALILAKICPKPSLIVLIKNPENQINPSNYTLIEDPRVLALNYGSLVLLESLQVKLKSIRDIKHIHVSNFNNLGRCIIHSKDFQIPKLGIVTTYSDLINSLKDKVKESGITFLNASKSYFIQQSKQEIRITSSDFSEIQARVCVKCDGSIDPSINELSIRNNQSALISTVTSTFPKEYWAWERFTKYGPLALLPYPKSKNCYSLVLCSSTEKIHKLNKLDNKGLSEKLSRITGYRLGNLLFNEKRYIMPLDPKTCSRLVEGRLVSIGNAAQILHPVAGQGLNLGFRDASALGEALKAWLRNVENDTDPFLTSFLNSRKLDRCATIGITNFLPLIFSKKLMPVRLMCSAGFLMLDLIKPSRKFFLRHFLFGFR